jgi:hypothetical protein
MGVLSFLARNMYLTPIFPVEADAAAHYSEKSFGRRGYGFASAAGG